MIERMGKKDQKYISASELMGVRMKRENQNYISASKLMGVRMKRGKTQIIIIVIDIFPFFIFPEVSNCLSNLGKRTRSLTYLISI